MYSHIKRGAIGANGNRDGKIAIYIATDDLFSAKAGTNGHESMNE